MHSLFSTAWYALQNKQMQPEKAFASVANAFAFVATHPKRAQRPFWDSIRVRRGSRPLPSLLGYLAEGFAIGSSGWVEEVKGWRVSELALLRTLVSGQAIGLPHGGE